MANFGIKLQQEINNLQTDGRTDGPVYVSPSVCRLSVSNWNKAEPSMIYHVAVDLVSGNVAQLHGKHRSDAELS